MSQIHQCKDNSDIKPLHPSLGLYLKPIARLHVSVQFPELKQNLAQGGKSVSSWDIMERIKGLVNPETFIFLRVVKNTLEFIRFEGDLENKDILKRIVSRLDGKTMKVTGFKEPFKIRAAEAKLPFPSKYDWDSYFRDAKNMNEMKAGERPDTVHLQNLPSKWFEDRRRSDRGRDKDREEEKDNKVVPSEKLFKKIFSTYGEVRAVDIPVCDPYRSQMSSSVRGISTFTFSNDNVFEAYVQYKDYMSFVKAMDALRECMVFYQETPIGKYYVANVKVDFDKSKHLSDESIKRRKMERERLSEKDKTVEKTEKLSKMEQEIREKKLQEKEKKENEKNLAKIEFKIAMEERKYLIARRKLEAIRLMDYLFETIKRNIVETAEKNRNLKQKTKEEMKRLEKHVLEKNAKERENLVNQKGPQETENDKHIPSKVRKIHSSVKHVEKPQEVEEPRKEADERGEVDRQNSNSKHHAPPRYLGDWELKGKSHLGSEVKVSSNYVPLSAGPSYRGRGGYRGEYFRGRGGGPPPYPHPHPPPHYPHPGRHYDHESHPHHYYRGRGRGMYRGRGEHHSHYNGPGPTVSHDFSYLEELDRAYEKYFSSITKRHSENDNNAGS